MGVSLFVVNDKKKTKAKEFKDLFVYLHTKKITNLYNITRSEQGFGF